jgi:ribonuclease HII
LFFAEMKKPDYSEETLLYGEGFRAICGIDEVGRGPLAGPVTAAAVILDPNYIPEGLNDSKRLSEKQRERLYSLIIESSLVSIIHVSVEDIDRLNILQASLLAMRRAAEGLATLPDYALIDGNKLPQGLPCAASALVKGDSKSVSIAAASIVAKISRDRLMTALGRENPGYGWEKNAGYPTKEHLLALRDLGVTPHHRRSFRPVHNILYPLS